MQQVEHEVRVHAAAGEHPDVAVEGLRHVSGILERLPTRLQELPVLRIHDRSLLGREAEEVGIELCETLERGSSSHELWIE